VLAELAARGRPATSLALVDWADEEGARFGYSLLGSSAAAGLLDVETARRLRDADGAPLPDVLAANGVVLEDMPAALAGLEDVAAYAELHIEQGPVLDEVELATAAVDGCLGVRRSAIAMKGRTGHAGATPMNLRHDPVQAAATLIEAVREAALEAGGLATVGVLRAEPGAPSIVAGEVDLTVDLRHREEAALDRLDAEVGALAERVAEAEGCAAERSLVWSTEPVRFDAELVERARALAGAVEPLTSGALHDAAAVARAGVPAVMLFVRTRGGVSHSREEDAREEDLAAGIEAFGALVEELVDGR
jgi:hydantoinase/carbamoylase family amidase